MKPTAHIIIGMFIVASMAASCDSCNKKHDDSNNTTITTSETIVDTTVTADVSEPAIPNSSEKAITSKVTSKISKDKSTAEKNEGYSAADGTDAENHDGDQYTKNDQKAMPSGPPMK